MKLESLVRYAAGLDWSAPKMRIFDYVMGIGFLGYGIYIQDALTIAAGVFGLVLAIANPAGRLQRFMRSFVRPAPTR